MDNVVYTGNIIISSNKHKSKKKYFGVLHQSGLFKLFKDEKKYKANKKDELLLELKNYKLDNDSSSQQCYLRSKLDNEEYVLQGSDIKETDAWKQNIHDTLFLYEENRDEVLKNEIAQIKHDLNDMWNIYAESEHSSYDKQTVEKIIELNSTIKAKEKFLLNMIFNFPQKKNIDVTNIKLYSSTNIKIEKLIASKKVHNIEVSGDKEKLKCSNNNFEDIENEENCNKSNENSEQPESKENEIEAEVVEEIAVADEEEEEKEDERHSKTLTLVQPTPEVKEEPKEEEQNIEPKEEKKPENLTVDLTIKNKDIDITSLPTSVPKIINEDQNNGSFNHIDSELDELAEFITQTVEDIPVQDDISKKSSPKKALPSIPVTSNSQELPPATESETNNKEASSPPPLMKTNAAPPPPPLMKTNAAPPPPPLMKTNAAPPPPPLMKTNAAPPPPPLMKTNAAPPPPPPMSAGSGGPPPPPPPPMLGSASASPIKVAASPRKLPPPSSESLFDQIKKARSRIVTETPEETTETTSASNTPFPPIRKTNAAPPPPPLMKTNAAPPPPPPMSAGSGGPPPPPPPPMKTNAAPPPPPPMSAGPGGPPPPPPMSAGPGGPPPPPPPPVLSSGGGGSLMDQIRNAKLKKKAPGEAESAVSSPVTPMSAGNGDLMEEIRNAKLKKRNPADNSTPGSPATPVSAGGNEDMMSQILNTKLRKTNSNAIIEKENSPSSPESTPNINPWASRLRKTNRNLD